MATGSVRPTKRQIKQQRRMFKHFQREQERQHDLQSVLFQQKATASISFEEAYLNWLSTLSLQNIVIRDQSRDACRLWLQMRGYTVVYEEGKEDDLTTAKVMKINKDG